MIRTPIQKIWRWFTTPDTPSTNRKNFLNVQIDAMGVGLASAAAPFLPVFLTRLGATNFQVGLLTSMPALTGLILAIFLGSFLQSRKNIVPWFSAARLVVIVCYALTGVVALAIPGQRAILAILSIWAFATLPQTVVNIAFSVVMNTVAGPSGRFELMSRRWSILGFTTAIAVVGAGVMLDRIGYPINYSVVFMAFSVGGLISFYFSSHITLPDSVPVPKQTGLSLTARLREFFQLIRSEKPFVSFTAKRFVFLTGSTLAAPLFPLYYVRVVGASNSWIGIINTTQTAILVIGYFLWVHQSRLKGSRWVLLIATVGMSLYPALVASTKNVGLIALFAGVAGIFQAGIDLVFFDELMKTIPMAYSATFVAVAQCLQYLSTVVSPLIGTLLADQIGLGGALVVSAVLRFIGFAWFFLDKPRKETPLPELTKEAAQ